MVVSGWVVLLLVILNCAFLLAFVLRLLLAVCASLLFVEAVALSPLFSFGLVCVL